MKAMRLPLLLALLALAAACQGRDNAPPGQWEVTLSPTAPEAVRWAADDVAKYLQGMGMQAVVRPATGSVQCSGGSGRVVFVGDGLGDLNLSSTDATDQTFRIAETRCDGGSLVQLSGGGLLGRQYAAYEWLHRLGVRFFHPEQEYVPSKPHWPSEPYVREHTPTFKYRRVGLHLTHPLELGDPFRLGKAEYTAEVERYVDWHVKNLSSVNTSGGALVGDRGFRRGFPTGTGFSLHNTQQGGQRIIDPDDPRTEEEQIAAAIDERMGPDPATAPQMFGFTFDPSEFTEIDDRDIVRQLTFIANYIEENYPGTVLTVVNHGTAQEPTPHYGVRYYNLSQFAPPNLGVRVHTLMFYDLFRPAPVYGNENFNFLYDFMVQEYKKRSLWYFPEAAWWLTFDIAVPLYLPITIEARDVDIQGISFMLEGKLEGVSIFGTGQEWGYWQNEYCSYRMAADINYRYRDCLADIVSPMGPAAAPVKSVLEDVIVLQERDFIYGGEILAYLVGTDPETEVAASVGIKFHPLPASPSAILRWDLAKVEDWLGRIEPPLRRMDADYKKLVERLRAVAPTVPADGLSWFDEILDGIEVTGLRARHAYQVYGALVKLRRAQLLFDEEAKAAATAELAAAKETTTKALEVIRRREAGYRYKPISRSIAGGPEGKDDENWTIYKYRYLNRTHHGYYYTRIDRLAEEAFAQQGDAVVVTDALLGPGEDLGITVTDNAIADPNVNWGDGRSEPGRQLTHSYANPGVYEVTVSGTRSGEPFEFGGRVARLSSQYETPLKATIVEPSSAGLIEGVLPALVFGRIDERLLALGFAADDTGKVALDAWRTLDSVVSAAVLESAPQSLSVPVVNRSTGTILASISLANARVRMETAAGPIQVSGQLSTQAVINAIVEIGGFEPTGARSIVASTLGYTPDTLPADVPFVVEYAVRQP